MANNDNIIYAKFNHGREITTDSRSQYAYGQVLKISGLHLPASFDADVSNKGDKQAKAIIGTDNELPIDDAFFLSGKDVIVMINVHAADKDGRTKYIIRIPVEKRPERADIELEPVEQDVISTAIATLNEAIEQTSANAESAENSANRAHESAVNAETSATSASNSEVLAQQYMERAKTAAENAEQSETRAKASEDNAKASEIHAEQIATEIEQYTERAETASTNAESSASIATQKATEASAFANIATTKANEASTSATNAQNSADNAQQSATSAQESANSASASASRALVNAEKTQSDKEIVELAKSNVLSAVGEAQTYATTAQSASQAIQDMNVQATTLESDSDATVEKSVDPVTGAVTLTYGIPKGVKGEKGDTGSKGDKGDPFVYSDFTPEQLASLKGEKGDKGDKGDQGIQGEQGIQGIQGIKGDTGDKGDKGDAFTYSDFTPEQLASLKGEKGDKGDTGNTGAKGDTGDSGVYVGTSAPSDTNVNVWIDSDGTSDFGLGVPPTAQTVAEMDETESSIWIYTGSEPGYIVGNWYYYNGSTWVSGGVYGAGVVDPTPTQGSTNAVQSGGVYEALHNTDTTLTQSGQAADAKMVGDKIGELKSEINNIYQQEYSGVSVESGNLWFEFMISAGNTYIFKNNSGYAMTAHTLAQASGYDYIELIGTIAANASEEFTATQDAKAIVIYSRGAGNFTVCAKTSFAEMQKDVTNSITDLSTDIEEKRTVLDSVNEYGFKKRNLENGFELGNTGNGSLIISATNKAITYNIQSINEQYTLTTDWEKYKIYIWTFESDAWSGGGWIFSNVSLTVPFNGRFVISKIDNSDITPSDLEEINTVTFLKQETILGKKESISKSDFVSICHQGYSSVNTVGNNLLSGYKLAKEKGFDYGECDVKLTSDNVVVCCHDASFIDSTTGNTIVIAEHTLQELKSYNYYGGTIATLDEVLNSCKINSLGLVIDQMTGAILPYVLPIVKKYGMQDRVMYLIGWASGNSNYANNIYTGIKTFYKKSKVQFLLNTTNAGEVKTYLSTLDTGYTRVYVSVDASSFSVNDIIDLISNLDGEFTVAVWVIDNVADARRYLPYITALTSNKIGSTDIFEV